MAQTDYGYYTSWDTTTFTGVDRWGGDIVYDEGLATIIGTVDSVVAGRFGGQAIRNPVLLRHAIFPATGVTWTAGVVRVQFRATTIGGSDRMIYSANNGANHALALWVLASGALEFRYGVFSSEVDVSGPTIAVDQWYDFEMGFVVSLTAGSWDVRQDGVSIMSASGVNTRGASSSNDLWSRVDLDNDAADFDDFIIRRGAATSLDADDYVTDSIGNPRVSHLLANGAGTYNQWVSTPAKTFNYENVNEQINDSELSYIVSGAIGTRASWFFEDLPGSAVEVLDLYQSTAIARITQGDHMQFLRIGGVDYEGLDTPTTGGIHTGSEYYGHPKRWGTNPSTGGGQWIVSQVNGLEGGIERAVSSNTYASQAALVVLWGAPGLPNSKRLHFRDEYDRRNREACRSFTGLGGSSGEPSWDGVRTPQDSLLSMYQGDSQANLDLEVQSGTNKAQVGATLTGIGHPRQGIYADDQRWAVDIDVLDQGAKTFEAGAVVRHTDTSSPADWGVRGIHARNYTAAVLFDGASTFTCEIRWHPGGGVTQTRIASAPAGAISWGTEFELDVEIQNVAGPSGNRVAIGVKIDGSYLTFTTTTTGVSVQAPWVVDDRTEGISLGNGAGPWYYSADSSPTPQVTFDNWRALPLSNIQLGGGGTGDDEDCSVYESVVMGNECTGKTGTLLVPQTWPVRLLPPQHRIQRHPLRTGHKVVRTTDRRARRIWEVLCKIATTAEREALATFIDDHRGSELPFDWVTPVPYAETITGRLTRSPDLDTLQRLPFFEDFTIEVTEMFCPA